ncbi:MULTISPECIES: hypothetical protein [Streptomycetaceae]|uniref:hypothetical protein n=1 Tax=Streptomycetaceae TaxID=2062 RepID=UPI00037F1BB9|nr:MULTISPECIES: hypothetical protein [Streptomycetaceae]
MATQHHAVSVAERLAALDRDATLADIAARATEWDRHLVLQAVVAVAREHGEFSANLMREHLPELAHGFLGAAISALHNTGVIEPTGVWVPSTSRATKGHRIAVWRLTARGWRLARRAPEAPPKRVRRVRTRPDSQLDLFAA